MIPSAYWFYKRLLLDRRRKLVLVQRIKSYFLVFSLTQITILYVIHPHFEWKNFLNMFKESLVNEVSFFAAIGYVFVEIFRLTIENNNNFVHNFLPKAPF